MNIRIMKISDYDAVYQLWLSCSGIGLNNFDDSPEGIERFLQRNPESCFVAETNGKLAGVIMAGHDGRRGHIYHMAVDPLFRRQKIGSMLLDHALLSLKEQGISKVSLVVFESNTGGNAFGENHGFTPREDLIYRNRIIENSEQIDT